MRPRAVLLVNLGSPASTSPADVRHYLRQFLGDERVLDMPKPLRWLLLETVILPRRPKKTAHAYGSVWTSEGSPLLVVSLRVQAKLAAALGADTPVYLAMRYGEPSIPAVIRQMAADGMTDVLLIPQYPHYAMSSWETVVAQARASVATEAPAMRMECLLPFAADPDYIAALAAVSAPWLQQPYDHLLFSYHGLPARHMRKADSSHCHCLEVPDCCQSPSPAHATCYRAQCFATTRALAERAGLDPARYSVSFQSRLAGEPWLEPFTDFEFKRLAAAGVGRLLVICPSFVADCLETLEEIRLSGRDTFLAAGGKSFDQIPCLNDQEPYIAFLAGRVERWLRRGSAAPAAAAAR